LVLDQEPSEDGTLLDPDRYLPPSHKMVADALKVCTFCSFLIEALLQ
jgi:hypothetical protein